MGIEHDFKNKTYALTTPDYEPVIRRMGLVASYEPANHTCSVFLGGSADRVIPGVSFLNSYFPVVGESVWVDIKGVDMVIVGTTNNGEWQPYETTIVGMSPGNHGQVYRRRGSDVYVDFNFQWTGTNGTGTVFSFTGPVPANDTMLSYVGSMRILDASTGEHKAGVCFIEALSSVIQFIGPTGILSGNFGAGSQLFASGDLVIATITYQAEPGT